MTELSPTPLSGWQDPTLWSTELFPSGKQFEQWCEFVNRAHLTWDIQKHKCDCFPAFIREGRQDGFRVANLTSAEAGIRGCRGPSEIARDDVSLYNVLYIVKGSECLVIDGNEVHLSDGSFVIWDSTRPMKFITGPELHQVTLAVEHERMHRAVPRAGDFVGKAIKASTGVSRVFVNHLLSIDEQFGDLSRNQSPMILDAALNLLSVTLGSQEPPVDPRTSNYLFEKIRIYIEQNLGAPDLSIKRLAQEHSISVRHLHRIFSDRNLLVGQYILQRRLERCRADLASPASAYEKITEIAFRWGIEDSSTFSKVFKRQFGLSPREFKGQVHH